MRKTHYSVKSRAKVHSNFHNFTGLFCIKITLIVKNIFQKICSLRGWSQGGEQYKKTYDSMIQIWEGLRQKADANQDGQVYA